MPNRVAGVPVALLVLVVLGGCSGPPARSTAPGAPVTLTDCGDESDAGPPGGDSLALWVDSGGALGPPRDWTKAWELAVYRDGTVLRSLGSGLDQAPLSPTTIDRVDPCVVDRTAERLAALATADFEVPLPTDMSTTVISLRDGAQAPTIELRIYGLGQESWRPTDPLAGAPDRIDRANQNRQSVLDLMSGLHQQPERWMPDRLRVVERAGEPYGHRPPTLAWPWGSLDEVMSRRASVPACGEIIGGDVARLTRALGNAPAASQWSDFHRTTVVAVAPLMPGQLGCPA